MYVVSLGFVIVADFIHTPSIQRIVACFFPLFARTARSSEPNSALIHKIDPSSADSNVPAALFLRPLIFFFFFFFFFRNGPFSLAKYALEAIIVTRP